MTRDATEQALLAAVAALHQRIATVHERVDCPKCRAPQGWRCWRVNDLALQRRPDRRPVKHPHAERLRADGIADR